MKITKRKTNTDLLSKKKMLEQYGDFPDTLGCLPGDLHLEVHKSIYSIFHERYQLQLRRKQSRKLTN